MATLHSYYDVTVDDGIMT